MRLIIKPYALEQVLLQLHSQERQELPIHGLIQIQALGLRQVGQVTLRCLLQVTQRPTQLRERSQLPQHKQDVLEHHRRIRIL